MKIPFTTPAAHMDLQTSKAKISIDLFPRSHKPITPPKKSHLLATSWHHRQCLIHRPPCFLVARSTHIDMSSSWMPRFEKHHLATNILWFQSLGLNGEKNTKTEADDWKADAVENWSGSFHWIPVEFPSSEFFREILQWNPNQFPTEVSCAPCFFVWKWFHWWVGRWGFPTITDPGTDADPPANNEKQIRGFESWKKQPWICCHQGIGWIEQSKSKFLILHFDDFNLVNLVNFHGIFVEIASISPQ